MNSLVTSKHTPPQYTNNHCFSLRMRLTKGGKLHYTTTLKLKMNDWSESGGTKVFDIIHKIVIVSLYTLAKKANSDLPSPYASLASGLQGLSLSCRRLEKLE